MFVKGVSGNPGGKSKIQADFERKCREFMEKEGWDGLVQMARDKKTRQWALSELMNRGFGRPKESLDVTTRDESLRSPDGLASAITKLIAGEAVASDGVSQPGTGTA